MALTDDHEHRLAGLMRRVLAGDRQAEEDFDRHARPLAHQIMRRLGLDANDSADAVQEALTKLIVQARAHPTRKFHWTETRPFWPWFYTFCQNTGRDYRRRSRRNPRPQPPEVIEGELTSEASARRTSFDPALERDDADTTAERRRLARVAWSCIDEMPTNEANAFKLWIRWQKTQNEIARELGAKPGTVGSWISRGCETVRDRLAAEGFVLVGECSRGVRTLIPDTAIDLDKGRAGRVTADLNWKRVDGRCCELAPWANSRIAPPPVGDFEQLTVTSLATLPYGDDAIDERRLTPGAVFAAKTRSGNLAKLRVIGRDADLEIEWVTYTPRPAGSRVVLRLEAGLIVSCRLPGEEAPPTTEGDMG